MIKRLAILLGTLGLLLAFLTPAQAEDGFIGWSGTKTCQRNYYAVLHMISRGKVYFVIENKPIDNVNREFLGQNNMAGTVGLGSWDWEVAPQYTWERSPKDYYVSDIWATCSPEQTPKQAP